MAPFKSCMVSSQQVLYKSLYLNPLSESVEHSETLSSFFSETTCLSARSISASSTFWLGSADDQASSSSAWLQPLQKGNDAPQQKLGRSLVEERVKLADKRKVHASAEKSVRWREAEESIPFFTPPTPSFLSHMWDEPECEIGPASSWSTLGNRTLLCRPLPLDVGCCVCYIKRERHNGIYSYILYTDEGHGRQDRKLAFAVHKRPAGRSEFVIYAANLETITISATELGRVRANLLGTRHSIFYNLDANKSGSNGSPNLLGLVMFEPTVSSLTGAYRVLRVVIPKYQSTQISPFIHVVYRFVVYLLFTDFHMDLRQRAQSVLAPDWEEHPLDVHTLYSRTPNYNKVKKCYELDFRERLNRSSKIKTSAKNMLLTMNENGKQAILIFGKIGKVKYLLEYRFPLSAYQAFAICLSSLDSKLCCTI